MAWRAYVAGELFLKGRIKCKPACTCAHRSCCLVSIALAREARGAAADCQAFGQVYRDGPSFTLSTGEYGYRRVYICTNGKWNDYDGSVLPLHRAARPASAPRSAVERHRTRPSSPVQTPEKPSAAPARSGERNRHSRPVAHFRDLRQVTLAKR
jgi:hypothetical protein